MNSKTIWVFVAVTLCLVFMGIPQAMGQDNSTVPAGNGTEPEAPVDSAGNGTDTGSAGGALLHEICMVGKKECTESNSVCKDDGSNTGTFRCACISPDYHAYTTDLISSTVTKYCGKVVSAQQDGRCAQCEANKGICVSTGDATADVHCQCPASQSGANCEIVHLTVTCNKELMTICYTPHTGVDPAAGWRMYAENMAASPACVGSLVVSNETGVCEVGDLVLVMNLTEYATCGTKRNKDVSNIIYTNRMIVDLNEAALTQLGGDYIGPFPMTFNTFCSFTAYQDSTFDGIGVGRINGNDRGEQVTPSALTFTVFNELDQQIQSGKSIRVGDKVYFMFNMTKDGTYEKFTVRHCTASSSPVIPDSTAETRVVITDGCPRTTESTRNSWYLTQDTSVAESYYVLKTALVPMFKLSRSNNVFMHCSLQLCIFGEDECPIYSPATCETAAAAGRKKRSAGSGLGGGVVKRKKRATVVASDMDVSAVLTFQEGEANTAGGMSAGATAAIILGIIAGLALIAIVVVSLIAAKRKKKGGTDQINRQPQMFALPRIQTTHTRF